MSLAKNKGTYFNPEPDTSLNEFSVMDAKIEIILTDNKTGNKFSVEGDLRALTITNDISELHSDKTPFMERSYTGRRWFNIELFQPEIAK